ncbi:hypothetical protein T07_15159 [Trichinella nelsoni]|uniref:Uncharacterized protein n=1 Tax=Trichinella nelsoni TaxID=6336 RepID=A0A0V0S7Z4_9BILA|nr:hypothetical protein T07_15159 [Trichinella nelsoni]
MNWFWPLKFRVVRSRGNGEFPISANTLRSCLFGSLMPHSPMQLPVNCMECFGTFTDLQAKYLSYCNSPHLTIRPTRERSRGSEPRRHRQEGTSLATTSNGTEQWKEQPRVASDVVHS